MSSKMRDNLREKSINDKFNILKSSGTSKYLSNEDFKFKCHKILEMFLGDIYKH